MAVLAAVAAAAASLPYVLHNQLLRCQYDTKYELRSVVVQCNSELKLLRIGHSNKD